MLTELSTDASKTHLGKSGKVKHQPSTLFRLQNSWELPPGICSKAHGSVICRTNWVCDTYVFQQRNITCSTDLRLVLAHFNVQSLFLHILIDTFKIKRLPLL